MKKSAENRLSVTLVSNGLKVFGVLHLPLGAENMRYPAVLFSHGFGGNKSGKFRLSVRQAEHLSRAGIAAFRIDFRGSGDSEGDFSDTTIHTQLEDARQALEFLQNHPNIDPDKIALLGRSLGGAIATQLASESQVSALALWCPLFDAKPWFSHGPMKEFHFLGQPLSQQCITEFSALDSAQPLSKLKNTPMLIVSCGKDEVLGSYHHEQYLAHRTGCPQTEHLALAHSCHDFSHQIDQQTLLESTTSFFRGIV